MNDLLKETGNADKICTNSMIDIQTKFIAEVKQKIRQSQYEAMKAVNVQLINLYWEIGKSIAGKQSESWGKAKSLAEAQYYIELAHKNSTK